MGFVFDTDIDNDIFWTEFRQDWPFSYPQFQAAWFKCLQVSEPYLLVSGEGSEAYAKRQVHPDRDNWGGLYGPGSRSSIAGQNPAEAGIGPDTEKYITEGL